MLNETYLYLKAGELQQAIVNYSRAVVLARLVFSFIIGVKPWQQTQSQSPNLLSGKRVSSARASAHANKVAFAFSGFCILLLAS